MWRMRCCHTPPAPVMRCRCGGITSYLQALDVQRSLYSARQSLISLQLSDLVNRVTLYKVLGAV